jgi:hypothetical protein
MVTRKKFFMIHRQRKYSGSNPNLPRLLRDWMKAKAIPVTGHGGP